MIEHPPCWPEGQPCPNRCAARYYDHHVHGRTDLGGPWAGWRTAGRDLVSPEGERISPERLRGLLWRQEAEERISKARGVAMSRSEQLIRVVVVSLAEWRRDGSCAA